MEQHWNSKNTTRERQREGWAGSTHHVVKPNPYNGKDQPNSNGTPKKPFAIIQKRRVPPPERYGTKVVCCEAHIQERGYGAHLDEEALCLARGIVTLGAIYVKFFWGQLRGMNAALDQKEDLLLALKTKH